MRMKAFHFVSSLREGHNLYISRSNFEVFSNSSSTEVNYATYCLQNRVSLYKLAPLGFLQDDGYEFTNHEKEETSFIRSLKTRIHARGLS